MIGLITRLQFILRVIGEKIFLDIRLLFVRKSQCKKFMHKTGSSIEAQRSLLRLIFYPTDLRGEILI
jgi:hypothetical protein